MGKEQEGLLDLEKLESTNNVDDLLKLDIFEEDVSIAVPGGDKETPNAKPYDASEIPIPGGDKEAPNAKPYDQASLSIPSGAVITADQYNQALGALKKSFKEAADFIEVLENVTVVPYDIDEVQEAYTEAIIDNAIFESYIDGPYFEAVKNSDKDDIKKVIQAVKKAAPKKGKNKYNLSVFNSIAKEIANDAKSDIISTGISAVLWGAITYAVTKNAGAAKGMAQFSAGVGAAGAVGGAAGTAIEGISSKIITKALRKNKKFTTTLWQMIGTFNLREDEKIEEALSHYNELFKEQLGEYVLNATKLKCNKIILGEGACLLIVDNKKEKTSTINIEISNEDLKDSSNNKGKEAIKESANSSDKDEKDEKEKFEEKNKDEKDKDKEKDKK